MTETYTVSQAYARGPQIKTLEKADDVIANIYTVVAFTPPVPIEDLTTARDLLVAAMTAQLNGGKEATAIKNQRLKELRALLKELASYVQMVASTDLALLLSSGFDANSTNRVSEILPAPTGLRVKNGVLHQSLTSLSAVRNARGYEMQYALLDENGTPDEWSETIFSTSSRKIPVNGLLAGRTYIYRVRAMGGLNGISDWSETVSHLAY